MSACSSWTRAHPRDAGRRPVPGGQDHQGVEDVGVEPGGVARASWRRSTAAASRPQIGLGLELVLEVAHAEGDVAGLVLQGQVGDPPGDRIGGVGLEEGQQVEERSLPEDRQQERGGGEVGLVEQGLQRRPAAGARDAERAAAEQRPGG